MSNQKINCNVHACKYNDQSRSCTLSDITVGNCSSSPHEKKDTECDSFEETNIM